MVDSLLTALGLTTGRFTSPHLHSFRERMTIGGEPIEPERLVEVYDEVVPMVQLVDERAVASGGQRLNFFMMSVALAYAAFADAPVDVAVVEVGLGGTWDATNVADGQVAVVTPVAIDHTRLLGVDGRGDRHREGGHHQARRDHRLVDPGARRRGDPPRTRQRGRRRGSCSRATTSGSPLGRWPSAGQQLSLRGIAGEYPDIYLPLHGEHQASNAATALAAVEAFLGGGEQRLDLDIVRQGFADVTSPGRLEIVRRSPTVLVDAAHNPAGMRALRAALGDAFTFTRLVGLVAIFADKEPAEMLEILEPAIDHVVITRNTSPRSMPPRELGRIATEIFGEDRVTVEESMPDAIDAAVTLAEEDGMGGGVIVTGSVVTAADARLLLGADDT